MSMPNSLRVQAANAAPVRPRGRYVLYWMTANRRPGWNFALQHAVDAALELRKPLVVLEALRCGYPWASDRLHAFVLQGMAANAERFADARVLYYPYVEPRLGDGSGLLERLAREASLVVADEFPCFFLPRMTAAAARKLAVRVETVDSNGLLPLRAADRVFQRAVDFRRFLQKDLPGRLCDAPRPDPLDADLPSASPIGEDVLRRWPPAPSEALRASDDFLASLPIDHAVPPAPAEGGWRAATRRLREFLARRLAGYGEKRNDPDQDFSSGLSPYLHFGHVSPHQVFHELAQLEGWRPDRLGRAAQGKREGWWGMSPSAEAFLDQLVVWRELGYNTSSKSDRYDAFESLPDWAQKTLQKHARDAREHVYSLEEFESAATHDPLWNAAQNQLRREGRIHNYLRMLWGKKILHWSASPRAALEAMIHLNNKYAVDGRNPNSYSGIFWILGRYDRPWGPERPVFGVVRYMSSENTARKFDVRGYVRAYADDD